MKISKHFKDKADKLKKSQALKRYKPKYEHIIFQEWTTDEINKIADEMFSWFNTAAISLNNLWLRDFAISKMIPPEMISRFCERSEYYRKIHDICQSIQESKLFKIGLKKANPMPIFALKNVAGWRDKQEITGNNGKDFIPTALNITVVKGESELLNGKT